MDATKTTIIIGLIILILIAGYIILSLTGVIETSCSKCVERGYDTAKYLDGFYVYCVKYLDDGQKEYKRLK